MLRTVLFTALLASCVMADYGASSSYTSYQGPQQGYAEPQYSYASGNNFYAPAPHPYPFLGWGIDWNQAFSTAIGLAMVMLVIGGIAVFLDSIATYYYSDFDSDLVFRALDGLNIPEVSQVVAGIEKLQKMYGAAVGGNKA